MNPSTQHTSKLAAGSDFPQWVARDLDGREHPLGVPHAAGTWKMVVVYRGRHCPLCTKFLDAIETYRARLEAIGIDLCAASADDESQLREHRSRLHVTYPLYYGLTPAQMQRLGLYISHPRSDAETDHPFAEPGLFVVNETGRSQVVDISDNPFVRPDLERLVAGLEWIRQPDNHYPIRGTYTYGRSA